MITSGTNPFIHQTTAYPSYDNSQIRGYHQASAQGVPSTLPTVEYRPTTEDYELAEACLNGNHKIQASSDNVIRNNTEYNLNHPNYEGHETLANYLDLYA